MGVSCRIYIRKRREGIYRAGQPISGILSYAIDEPTEYETAVLSLIGSAKCKWTQKSGKHNHVYTGEEEFLSMHLNILNKQSDETVTVPVGAYEFRFEFILPYDIPSSIEEEQCHIRYHVKAKFVKPGFFSRARKFENVVTVYGNVYPTSPVESLTYGLTKKLFKLCSSREHIVDLKVRISKSFLTPGENAALNLTVVNNSDAQILLQADLYCRRTYLSEGYFSDQTKTFNEKVEGCRCTSRPILAYETTSFTCDVPTMPHLYSIQHCKVIIKEYYVRIKINLPFPHRNATCLIPIVLGEGRYGDCSGIVELEDTVETGLEPSNGASPPSYWEVMNEDHTPEATGKTSIE